MSKKITFSKKARLSLAKGVDKLADAVTDGVTVAKSIELKDKVENLGAQIVKQASIKTGDKAGDGTTTSTLLAQKIFNEGLERIQAGSNAVSIKRGIDKATKAIVYKLRSGYSKDITDEEHG